MSQKIDLGVFIGRFQFFHNGHLDAIRQGLTKCERMLILIGSANQPRTYFNPFDFPERHDCIHNALTDEERARVEITCIEDSLYNNTGWIASVQAKVQEHIDDLKRFDEVEINSVGLVGFRKDGTSYYLSMFPQWGSVEIADTTGLSATPLRQAYFADDSFIYDEAMPESTVRFLRAFQGSNEFKTLLAEYLFIERYKAPYRALKFPPKFVTVDACVLYGAQILLIQRRDMPGQGLWAMPGGHLDDSARVVDHIVTELYEETQIDVPEAVVRGHMEEPVFFDAVHRSSRGRTITFVSRIILPTTRSVRGRVQAFARPAVKGGDDAKRAKWWDLNKVEPSMMFEDHYAIIKKLTANL